MFFNNKQQTLAENPSRDITIYLSPREPAPFAPPVELQPYINADTWNARVPQIRKLAAQYQKPMFERVWFLVGLLAVIVLPVAMFRVILGALDKGVADTDNPQLAHHYFEARSISFGVMIGVVFAFYLPLAVWKFIGSRRANALLARWAREDRALHGPNAILPTWKVKTPGVFNAQMRLILSVPVARGPGSFSPNAPVPTYLNAPTDSYAGGQPRMGVFGGAPVSMAGPTQNPFQDQNPFDDKTGMAGARV